MEKGFRSVTLRWSHDAALAASPLDIAPRTYHQGVIRALTIGRGCCATRLALKVALEDVSATVVAYVLISLAGCVKWCLRRRVVGE